MLRKLYKEKRKSLSLSQRLKLDDLLLVNFQKSPIEIPDWILSYRAMERHAEFDPYLIEKYCKFRNPGCQMLFPVMHETNGTLRCVITNDHTIFQENELGIEEPLSGEELDPGCLELVIVPLHCFDAFGNRVGYGKGYYDRLLSRCGKNCTRVGFSYFDPVEEKIDDDLYDVPLHYVITPYSIFEFKNNFTR